MFRRVCLGFSCLVLGLTLRADGAFTSIINFGDSLSDVGNVYDQTFHIAPQSPPYFNGRYSNGALWVEGLAQQLTLSAPVASRSGGKNYAYAGVKTGNGNTTIFPFSFPNIGSQINSYLGSNTPAATQLFTVWGGGNDFIDGQSNTMIPVNNLVNHVTALANAGAKNFVVPNLPPLGQTPRFRGTANESVMDSRSMQFNSQLAVAMTNLKSSLSINIFQLDVAGFFADVLANPSAYGFTNVTGTALVGNMPAPNQDEYLFWDDIHPTRIGHGYLATFATELVSTHNWISSVASESWSTATNWDPSGAPAGDWIANLKNTQPALTQSAIVSSNSSVRGVRVSGNTSDMKLVLSSGANLNTGSIQIGNHGVVKMDGGSLNATTLSLDSGGAIESRLLAPNLSDSITVSGAASFSGSLKLRLDGAFVAYPGLDFDVITFGSRSGDLSIVNDTGLAGLQFNKIYSATKLTLTTTGLGGDANLDGMVNLSDFNVLAGHFGLSGAIWLDADFNFDGLVNLSDFNILAGNFGLSASIDGPTAQDWANLSAVVPEPAASILLLTLVLAFNRPCGAERR